MLFNTAAFALFFAVVFVLRHALDRWGRNGVLLAASYGFYAWWDWRFLGLLLVSTAVDFTVARAMPGSPAGRKRRLLLVSIVVNLGVLGFFKYFDFFADSAATCLATLGLNADVPTLGLVLPVGISFYTFQTLSYTVDVYRGRQEPTRDPLLFALFVAYFPQLVAGPIERASHLLPQLAEPRKVDARALSSGALLVLLGLFRKVVIADGVAPLVDAAFANPAEQSSLRLLEGVFLFGFQIYGDFAGYSGIARGVSRMLGIELVENFRRPYLARSVTDFWRRWHMSLSAWLKDYVYIPLGGNRGGRARTARNVLVTMLLGGLWHGAAWTFVIWGGLHGLALVAHKWVVGSRSGRTRSPTPGLSSAVRGGLAWVATTSFVWLAWLLFRAPDLATAGQVASGILELRGPVALHVPARMALVAAAVLAVDIPQERSGTQTVFLSWPVPARATLYASAALAVTIFWTGDANPFIYFQF